MASTSIYSSFKNERDIRLLHIRSQGDRSSIKVTFEVFSLDSDVQFTALSYVWGDLTPPSCCLCNGQKISITRNLYDILSQLQQDGYDGLLWVDAICINQKDNEEKRIQVSMMRNIYRRATNVIFWLGKEEKYDRAAVRLMNAFREKHQNHLDLEPLRTWSLQELGLPTRDCGWLGWASLLSRPWFGRIWIVQEFLNATRSVFRSGALAIPTDLLVRCAHATGVCAAIGAVVISSRADFVEMRELILRPLALSIDQMARSIAGIDDVRLFDLWTRSQLLGATDPRDRVFALLSTQRTVTMDLVDYNKDVATVYLEIARIALTMTVSATDWYRRPSSTLRPNPWGNAPQRTSRFLACKTRTPCSSDLPSWVPDWRPAGFTFIPLTRYYPGTAYFTHDYNHATINGKILHISGFIVDSPRLIIDSTPYMDVDRPCSIPVDSEASEKAQSWPKRIFNWQIMYFLAARGLSSFATSDELLEAFCRTMAFNALPDKSATPSAEYIAGFRMLHSKLEFGVGKTHRYRLKIPHRNTSGDQSVVYESVFQELSRGRKFCVTSNGSMAWVPRDTKLGDRLCFLAGCAVPFVIKPVGVSFELLGDCYLRNVSSDESITFRVEPRTLRFR